MATGGSVSPEEEVTIDIRIVRGGRAVTLQMQFTNVADFADRQEALVRVIDSVARLFAGQSTW